MEKKLELFELRRHTEDEVAFVEIETLLSALDEAGYPVERHFYEDGNFKNQEIQILLDKNGLNLLPISKMNDEIAIKGRYPTIEEIADYFDVTISYEDENECCSGEEGECCCGHHHHHDGECCHHHDGEEHECRCHHHEE